MNFEQKESLAEIGRSDKAAIARRLKAARLTTGLSQQEFAKSVEVKKTTYNAQEKATSNPSIDVMRALYREYRIDFNFILHGDFAQLPADVQGVLFSALASLPPSDNQTAS